MVKVSLARVQRSGVKNQVFEQLRDRIIDRTWPPGAKIPSENALAHSFGVSRVSIREALHMLVSPGLLKTRHGGGTYVRKYSGEIFLNPLLPLLALDKINILNVLEYRKIQEKGIVSLAVKRAGSAEIEQLECAFKAMKEHRNDPRLFNTLSPGAGQAGSRCGCCAWRDPPQWRRRLWHLLQPGYRQRVL